MNTSGQVVKAEPVKESPTSAGALLSTRPPFIQSLLRILMAVGAGITLLLGLAAYQDMLPKDWAVYVGVATALLLPLKEFIIGVGDILDDGVKNGSFKLQVLLLLLLPCFLLTSCGMSPREMLAVGLGTGWKALPIAKAEYDAVLGARVKAEAPKDPAAASGHGGKITRLVQP